MLRRHRTILLTLAGISAAGWVGMTVGQQTSLPSLCGDASVLLSIKAMQAAGMIEPVILSQFFMVTAMMIPMTYFVATRISDRAFPHDRAIAATVFCLSYCSVWFLAGTVLMAAHLWALLTVEQWMLVDGASALVVIWHATGWRQAMINASHALRIVSAQRPAMIRQSVREGVRAGLLCVPICAPAMLLAMAAGPYHLLVSAIVSVVLWAERLLPPERPIWGWRSWFRGITRISFLIRSTVRLVGSILVPQRARSTHA